MNILIVCSKAFYNKIPNIKEYLENKGHKIFLPNSYLNSKAEDEARNISKEEHSLFKAKMFKMSEEKIKQMDAILVLNFDKNKIKNYIGGATFLEMYDAFRLNKKIYMYHDIPEGILYDEICGFSPIIINERLDDVK